MISVCAWRIIDHESWNPPAAYPPEPVKAEDLVGYSPEIEAGRWDVDDVIRPIYKEAGEALPTQCSPSSDTMATEPQIRPYPDFRLPSPEENPRAGPYPFRPFAYCCGD